MQAKLGNDWTHPITEEATNGGFGNSAQCPLKSMNILPILLVLQGFLPRSMANEYEDAPLESTGQEFVNWLSKKSKHLSLAKSTLGLVALLDLAD